MEKSNKQIFADNAATTPISNEVLEAMKPYFRNVYGNPSSIHDQGKRAKKAVEESRERIAFCLKCHPDEIFFTSGGTEANNWAIFGLAMASEKRCLISSKIEHPSVMNAIKALERFEYEAKYIGVNSYGELNTDELERQIKNDATLVSVMIANNETGALQPVEKVAEIAHDRKTPFFSDAVQAIGNVEVDLSSGIFDVLSFSGHKLSGPKGIGALYIKRGTPMIPLLMGGGQESGLRSGTENVPGIVGLATAVEQAIKNLQKKQSVKAMKDRLIEALRTIPMSYTSGRPDNTLPGTLHICFDYVDGSDLVRYLNHYGIFVSSSSACASNSAEPSHVLLAMGIPYERARGALRISMNDTNTLEEIMYIAETIKKGVASIRNMNIEYRNLYIK